MSVAVRALRPEDREAWEPLWAGYLAFYETDLDPVVTEVTWQRFGDASEPMHAVGAFDEQGNLLGFAHLIQHRSTWSSTAYCYLEDLYTTPEARGRGVGRALIAAVADAARRAGADKLYWQTHATNDTARALYDQVARHEGFLVYDHPLD